MALQSIQPSADVPMTALTGLPANFARWVNEREVSGKKPFPTDEDVEALFRETRMGHHEPGSRANYRKTLMKITDKDAPRLYVAEIDILLQQIKERMSRACLPHKMKIETKNSFELGQMMIQDVLRGNFKELNNESRSIVSLSRMIADRCLNLLSETKVWKALHSHNNASEPDAKITEEMALLIFDTSVVLQKILLLDEEPSEQSYDRSKIVVVNPVHVVLQQLQESVLAQCLRNIRSHNHLILRCIGELASTPFPKISRCKSSLEMMREMHYIYTMAQNALSKSIEDAWSHGGIEKLMQAYEDVQMEALEFETLDSIPANGTFSFIEERNATTYSAPHSDDESIRYFESKKDWSDLCQSENGVIAAIDGADIEENTAHVNRRDNFMYCVTPYASISPELLPKNAPRILRSIFHELRSRSLQILNNCPPLAQQLQHYSAPFYVMTWKFDDDAESFMLLPPEQNAEEIRPFLGSEWEADDIISCFPRQMHGFRIFDMKRTEEQRIVKKHDKIVATVQENVPAHTGAIPQMHVSDFISLLKAIPGIEIREDEGKGSHRKAENTRCEAFCILSKKWFGKHTGDVRPLMIRQSLNNLNLDEDQKRSVNMWLDKYR